VFKIRSIAVRLILAISLTVAVTCAVLGGFSIVQQRALMQLALDQQLKLQYDSVIAAIDYEGRSALAVSTTLAALPLVGEAVANGDRDALAALLGDATKALKAQGIPLVTFEAPPAVVIYRGHEPKLFGDDISSRRNTVVESIKTGRQIVGVEPGRETLGIFGLTPIVRDGKSIGNVDVGAAFGAEFVDHAKKRLGIDLAVHSFDGKAFKKLSSTFGDSVVATEGELKEAMAGQAVRRDATLNGHSAAIYLGQIKNYAGTPVGILEIVKDTTEYEAAAAASQRHLILGTVVILAAAILLAFLLARGLSRPLGAITAVMNRLSSGDTEVSIPGNERRDELGTMAKAVEMFRRSIIEAGTLREAQQTDKQRSELEKKALQRQMADRFEADVKSVVATVAKASQNMQRVAGEIIASINGTSERATAAATASEQASASVNTVAAATEELASSVRRDRPSGYPFQRRRRQRRRQGGANHRDRHGPRRRRRKDRRRAPPDRRDRKPDQSAGTQCHDRGRTRRRSRPGLCRRSLGGQGTRQPDCEGDRGDRRPGRRDPGRHRRLRHRDRRHQRYHPRDQRHRYDHCGGGGTAGFRDARDRAQRAACSRRHQRSLCQRGGRKPIGRPVAGACRQRRRRYRPTQPAGQRAVRKCRYFPGPPA